MATLNDMIEEVHLKLGGFTEDMDVLGTLKADIAASANTMSMDGPIYPEGSGFTPGVVEVGEELVYVQAVDPATGVATGVLRGQFGTVAQAHPAGTPVRDNPRYPRVAIKQVLNDAVRGAYPRVFGVSTTVYTTDGNGLCVVDSAAREVMTASVKVTGGLVPVFQPLRTWRFDQADKVLVTRYAGQQVRVTYMREPAALTALGDDFETVTGLPDYCREIAVLGACYRLTSAGDAARTAVRPASQAVMNQQGQQVSWGSVSKYFAALFEQRLEEATKRLQQQYPIRTHWEA